MDWLGKTLIVFGLVLTGVGVLIWSGFGKGWFGRLPGDINVERDGVGFHFPLVTCLLLSILVSLILTVLRR